MVFLFSPLFLTVIFIIFGLPKFSLTRFNGNGSAYLSRILNKNKNKNIQIFFLGNSRINRGIDPKVIEKELNIDGLNIGFRGSTYLRSYSLISEIFNLGYDPKAIVLGINIGSLYYDCLPNQNQTTNEKLKTNLEEFVKNNLQNIYNFKKTNLDSQLLNEYDEMINELYFSTNIENKKIRNMNSNIKDSKKFIFNLRHTYNHGLFLREPTIYSKAYDISLENSYLISFQRFLFVFNRSFQELFVLIKEIIRYRAFFPPYIKGYEDIYWVERFGDRDGLFQPIVTEETLKKSSILSFSLKVNST